MSVSPTLRDRVDALCQTLSLQPVTDAGLGLREALERCAAAAGVRYESVSATLELLELEVLGVSPGPAPSKKRGRDESPPRQEPAPSPRAAGLRAPGLRNQGHRGGATLSGALRRRRGADAATIKRYRELALTVHPDKGGSASAFKILNEAKSTLCDEDARAAYDRSLRESRAPAPAPKRRKMSGTPKQPRADAPRGGTKTGTGPCDCRGWALWLGSKPAENPCEGALWLGTSVSCAVAFRAARAANMTSVTLHFDGEKDRKHTIKMVVPPSWADKPCAKVAKYYAKSFNAAHADKPVDLAKLRLSCDSDRSFLDLASPVIGKGLLLRAAPALDSGKLAQLPFEAVVMAHEVAELPDGTRRVRCGADAAIPEDAPETVVFDADRWPCGLGLKVLAELVHPRKPGKPQPRSPAYPWNIDKDGNWDGVVPQPTCIF
ncbi:hypothetical protein JL722_6915 [Aureococcus anophagefferens]|nr:hypothetical protein JL722_6915 [Aureococcus anophagefferens]